ncbi:MAG: bifunctional UDP-N-acetylglucosamine diphosphorylase/glucosamine-1-phosphate N-acetyltransferase GlmU [Mariprofundaceae bacterium]|nr:bifunctional UDP-N-acetylglucosamine diphosphorylase/glucosamine-1-phosphate N-acetyltransferase GlmU [Mariprofundaceae bacterium]
MNQYHYSNLQVVVLAAGQGKRMRSATPKVLHDVLGRSMLSHVLANIEALCPQGIALVTGHGGEQVYAAVEKLYHVSLIKQAEQLGTGHAVQQAESACVNAEHVLIVCADTPLLQAGTLADLLERHIKSESDISFLSAKIDEPTGYGRVCRNQQGIVESIVEERDANADQRLLNEVSSGIFCVKQKLLFQLLQQVDNSNNQNEYYLPSIVPLALQEGAKVEAVLMPDANEMLGVNDRTQLRHVTELLQQRVIEGWEKEGVSIEQPSTVRIDVSVKLGMDTVIRAGSQLLGNTSVGDACEVGPYAVIKQSWVDDHVKIHAFSHLEQAHVGAHADIGPYARLRPQAELDEGVKIGNFVEIKKSIIGQNSKVNHLSYIGDTTMGQNCNVGAGTITCNYDGANKHKTVIGDGAFIGSDTKLIAPVTVGDGATIGAGSVITKLVQKNGLTLSARPEQRYVKDWKRPEKS